MKCLRCGLEITKWHPATPDDIDIHANRQDCIVELRAENERLRTAIADFKKEIDVVQGIDDTWQWAMNEMSDSVNDRVSAAIQKLQAALDAAEECPDCAVRRSETDSPCFMHRVSCC